MKKYHLWLMAIALIAYNQFNGSIYEPIYAQIYEPGYVGSFELDSDLPIFPFGAWRIYPTEAEAEAKAESNSLQEQFKSAVTYHIMAYNSDKKSEVAALSLKATQVINKIYRRNKNNILLSMFAGIINMGFAGKTSKLVNRISYTNRGLGNFEFALPNIPNNLEAKVMYLRTTVFIPTFFKNLTRQQLQIAKQFFDGYEAGMAKLLASEEAEEARQWLEELRTHASIVTAKIANRSSKTRKDVPKYLAQVDTNFFYKMRKEGNKDLIKMYKELSK